MTDDEIIGYIFDKSFIKDPAYIAAMMARITDDVLGSVLDVLKEEEKSMIRSLVCKGVMAGFASGLGWDYMQKESKK